MEGRGRGGKMGLNLSPAGGMEEVGIAGKWPGSGREVGGKWEGRGRENFWVLEGNPINDYFTILGFLFPFFFQLFFYFGSFLN